MSQALRRGAELHDEIALRDGVEPFVIPFGGTNSRGTIGFVNAAVELAGQIEAGVLPEPDLDLCPLWLDRYRQWACPRAGGRRTANLCGRRASRARRVHEP